MINKKRNKIVMYSLIGLATVSLAGIGFSAWIIDGSVEAQKNVIVNVSNMEDRTTLIKVVDDDSDFEISFDYDKDSTNKNPNIVYDESETIDEDLEFKVVYTITSQSALNDGKHKINVAFSDTTKTHYSSLNQDGREYIIHSCINDFSFILPTSGTTIVTEPATLSNIVNTLQYTSDFKTATLTSTFTFDWGSYFNYKNPCEYGTGSSEVNYKERLENFNKDVVSKKDQLNIELTISSSYQQ